MKTCFPTLLRRQAGLTAASLCLFAAIAGGPRGEVHDYSLKDGGQFIPGGPVDIDAQLTDVADAITGTLNLLNAVEPDPKPPVPFRLLLGSPELTLKTKRDDLVVELENFSFQRKHLDLDIETELSPSRNFDEHQNRMDDCGRYEYKLVVHLLTENHADALEHRGVPRFVDHSEYHYFRTCTNVRERIVWMAKPAYKIAADPYDEGESPHFSFLHKVRERAESRPPVRELASPMYLLPSSRADLPYQLGSHIQDRITLLISSVAPNYVICFDYSSEVSKKGQAISGALEAESRIDVRQYAAGSDLHIGQGRRPGFNGAAERHDQGDGR